MGNHNTDSNAVCPFYKYETYSDNALHCEAVNIDFKDKKSREDFKAKFCCNFDGMQTCQMHNQKQQAFEKEAKRKEEQGMTADCYFKDNRKCRALTRTSCAGCSFYKTKEQVLQGRRKARAMLENLPENTKRAIMEKYYEGHDETERQEAD